MVKAGWGKVGNRKRKAVPVLFSITEGPAIGFTELKRLQDGAWVGRAVPAHLVEATNPGG
jgi:hypothetical protein